VGEIFTVQNDDHGRRLDRIVRRLLPEVGLGRIYHLIRIGAVRLNGKSAKPSSRVAKGDEISLPAAERSPHADSAESPETPSAGPHGLQGDAGGRAPSEDDIRRTILWESRDLLVLNKPIGALVHGRGSLGSAVEEYLSPRIPASLSFRPGPLHRLDRNTSGILVFSKSLKGAQVFSRLLRDGKIEKYYLALLDGKIRKQAEWIDRLERGGGWLFFIIGAFIVIAFGIFEFIRAPDLNIIWKVGGLALILGFVILLFSVFRERRKALKTDRYKDIIR